MNDNNNNTGPKRLWVLRVIQGMLVGGGAILPGISGGVLCVSFGIYQPMMALLAHPIRSFRTYRRLFVPFLIGWLAGFLLLARVVELMFRGSSAIATCLFIGLIAGTLPRLFGSAAKDGAGSGSYTGFAVSLFLSYTIFYFLKTGTAVNVQPDIRWYFFCGVIWGLSLIIPGMSSSSILIFIGLYQPMASGIAALDWRVILPLLSGIMLTAALLGRLVNRLLERYNTVVTCIILGIVITSTLLIIPETFGTTAEVILSMGGFAAGFAAARAMDIYGERLKVNPPPPQDKRVSPQ
jgi:putative membrane protein